MNIKAHAKINLFLDITGKLEDGYHEIDTVFFPISLADEIEIELQQERKLTLSCDASDIPGRINTITKAYELIHNVRPCLMGLDVRLHKNIPQCAGLGGSSADAASFITAINHEYGLNLSIRNMLEIARGVGADVPACMLGVPSRGKGNGSEVMTIGRNVHPIYITVVKPEVGFSTADMYSRYDVLFAEGRIKPPGTTAAAMEDAVREGDFRGICRNLYNVFEQVADDGIISEAKQDLKACGAGGALMTGSGSAVFGLFPDADSAQAAADKLSDKYQTFACESFGNR